MRKLRTKHSPRVYLRLNAFHSISGLTQFKLSPTHKKLHRNTNKGDILI